MTDEFDDIRSYRDFESKEICKQLLSQEALIKLLSYLLPGKSAEDFKATADKIESVWDFQHNFILPILQKNILPTFDELTVSGLENLDKNKAHLFISNHRDIVLDSALLNYFLHINDFSTAEIAIGDNLLKEKWIEDLVRLNKSFIVKRGLDNSSMLKASQKLSEYIYDTIYNRKESVWIAQRAGRAKDGNDETNRGLLTMFGMSSKGDLKDHFINLSIVPVSVSYEFDPCDSRKTKELYIEHSEGNYIKSEAEDIESMKMGIILPKGKGHLHFGKEISSEIRNLDSNVKKSLFISGISELIDKSIQSNYRVWPTNFIADSLITGITNIGTFTQEEEITFLKRIEKIESEINGNSKIVRNILLGMYQQPLLNKRKRGN